MDAVYGILGRLHPLITHLPIGFLVLCFLVFLKDRKKRIYDDLLSTLILWTGIAGALACISGYAHYIYEGLGYMTVRNHFWLGILTTSFCFFIFIQRKSRLLEELKNTSMGYLWTLGLVLVILTGHLGGNLSRGSNYLTEPLPTSLKKVIGQESFKKLPLGISEDQLDSAKLYADLIHPILNNKCLMCHGPKKTKGGLRLDSPESILAGGENGDILTLHTSGKGELLTRLEFPLSEDGHMPPDGKAQLTRAELNLLAAWLEMGNPFEGTLDSLILDKSLIMPFILKKEADLPALEELPTVSEAQKDSIRKSGLHIESLSLSSPLLVISAINKPEFSWVDVSTLTPIKDAITELDLSGTQVDSTIYTFIGTLSNLSKLNLSHTVVSESGLEKLVPLKHLKELNLTFTETGPEVFPILDQFPVLQSVYVFSSRIVADSITLHSSKPYKIEFGGQELPAIDSDLRIY
ncbi:MAG: hypothetical protein RLZZ241_2174 [Bacteroidota bacterium]|jgi:uncharacterized membrane protein